MTHGNLAIGVPADPDAAQVVLTHGRRLAQRLGLGWVAVLIRTGSAQSDSVRRVFELVIGLGGHLLCADATDVAAGLVEVSRREQAQLLVIGASRRPRLLRRFVRGTTERVLQAERTFDVVVAAEGVDV